MSRNTTRHFIGGEGSECLGDRLKSQSYTDINTQISGYSAVKWNTDFKSMSIDRRMAKRNPHKSTLDYGFLRELLGIDTSAARRRKSGNEGFVSDELREAVLKLRQEVTDLKLEIKDKNWLRTLEDLGDINAMDKDFLEALYMLRNAHKRGVFKSTQNVNVSILFCFVTCSTKCLRTLRITI